MADFDPGVALKVGNPDDDLTKKLEGAANLRNAMDAADRENAKRGAYPQAQGAFQQGQGAFGNPTDGWSIGKVMDEFVGTKPAY